MFFILTLILGLLAPVHISAQAISDTPATKKFTLTNFKNSSSWLGRYRLLRFSENGAYLAAVGESRDIVIYDTASGEIQATIDNGRTGFTAFSFSPDSTQFVVQDADYLKVQLYETASGTMIREFENLGRRDGTRKRSSDAGKHSSLLDMGPAPVTRDWKNVILNSRDGQYQIVDLGTGEVKHTLEHASKKGKVSGFFDTLLFAMLPITISNSQISPDGKYVLINNGNLIPTVWNIESGQLAAKIDGHSTWVVRSAFSPNGEHVATSDLKGVTKIWDAASGKLLNSIGSKGPKAFLISWSPDSLRIMTQEHKKDVRVWEASTGTFLFPLENSSAAHIIYGPERPSGWIMMQDGKSTFAQTFDPANGKAVNVVPRQKNHEKASFVLMTPDGKYIITASKKYVRIWNAEGGLVQDLQNAVFPMSLSPDGKHLATGGPNETAILWSIE